MGHDPFRIHAVNLPRFRVPPGKLGLLVIAGAALPVLWKELVKHSRKLNEKEQGPSDSSEAAPATGQAGTEPPTEAPKGNMSRERTTKVGTKSAGVEVTTASPAEQEELEQVAAAEMDGAATPPPRRRSQRPTTDKAPEPDQPMNPKRTRHSRPD